MSKLTEVRDKMSQYGLPAMTQDELLTVLKFKGDIQDYYNSFEYKAAKELQRRKETPEKVKVTSSHVAAKYLSFLQTEEVENFHVLLLNRNSEITNDFNLSKGTEVATLVSIQTIIKEALFKKAQAIIVAHNHPSGNAKPSQADINITKQLKEAAKFFNIELFDHIIITTSGHFSFADEGII